MALSKYKTVIIAAVLIGVASVVAQLYVQSQVYYPIVRLEIPGGLSIAAILPETKERKACGAANDKFVAPLKQSCKDCKISMARCERQLEGLELAMHDNVAVPHPMVIAREARVAVMGPPETAKAGCRFLAAKMVEGGVATAACILPAAAPKS
jgi:hypothetical protein